MNPIITFLTALGQAFAAQTLYGDDHPMRRSAAERLLKAVAAALRSGSVRLSFLDNDVIVGSRVLTDLRGWEWGAKLSAAGIQRLEISQLPEPTADDIEQMLSAIRVRLASPTDTPTTWARHGVRIGPLSVASTDDPRDNDRLATSVIDALAFSGLGPEIDAVNYIHAEVNSGRDVPMAEVDGIVRALAVTIRREQGCLLPLLDIRSFDEYTTHCCNVAMLSMGLGDQLGLSDADTRAIGTAALLHDIGKTRIPAELLTKTGKLTPEERLVMQRHPVEGARILTGRGLGNSLAATVAYEHHIWFNGKGGYPVLNYPRTTHFASRIVHVSDIYDAISSKRPYHEAWPRDKALGLIRSLAGVELDPDIASAFMTMAAGATEVRHLLSEQASEQAA
jgi:putative nucleotidyltransferase with HDIG domain